MNKFLKSFFMILVLIFIGTTVLAGNNEISKVIISDIDVPYSNGRVLDTEAKVPKDARYRVIKVAWNTPTISSNKLYEVVVTLKANIGFVFSEETIGTINGKEITSKSLISDDEMTFSYIFDEEKSLVATATSTTRYRITTYYDEEQGTITPYLVRVPDGSNKTINITPKEGYKIKDVLVDGESVGAVNEYTFKKVKSNHTIKAYFEEEKQDKAEDKIELPSDESIVSKPIFSLLRAIFSIIEKL